MSVLEQILEQTREAVRRRRENVPLAALERELDGRDQPRPFAAALSRPGMSIIAEHKRRSPSVGTLRTGSTVSEIVTAYERGGAAALSILTEEAHFAGSLADLREGRGASTLPVLRKDFIVDTYQLYEAAAASADAVLLIVAALEPSEIRALHREARALDLAVLVETHDKEEVACALEVVEADIIGINNRSLADFTIDVARTYELLPDIPADKIIVSESGLHSREQLDELERAGVDAVLIGERLMRAPDPEAACRALTGREAPAHPALET